MYLAKRIGYWKEKEWEDFFSQFPAVMYFNEITNEKEIVKKILTSKTKQEIEANFEKLKKIGIINGIGPSWFPHPVRSIITWLFPYFRYEWHDLDGAIGGTEEDRKRGDQKMLEYSQKSIVEDMAEAIKKGNPIWILYKCIFSNITRNIIAVTFYFLVRIFGKY